MIENRTLRQAPISRDERIKAMREAQKKAVADRAERFEKLYPRKK